jgi:hypothetical protein
VDWTIFWAGFGAVGQWAAALATVAAVWVALRIARDSNATRIKVSASAAIISTPLGLQDIVVFEAVNVGTRAATLTSVAFLLPTQGRRLLNMSLLQELNHRKLEPTERVSLHLGQAEFAKMLFENGFTKRGVLPVVFSDSAGCEHRFNWKLDPKCLLPDGVNEGASSR